MPAFAIRQARRTVPGQFEDAESDTDKRTIPEASATVNSTSFSTPTLIPDDDDDDDDYYDDNDDFYSYDDDDSPLNMVGSSKGFAAAESKTLNVSHKVQTSVNAMERLEAAKRTLTIDRGDRATSEQVLDPRTRLILFKLLNMGFLEKLDGCLSTGKEANVYYATSGQASNLGQDTPNEYAIKVYKTSILVFKDRDKYVSGEHRWRRGYCKSNPRKMVKVWAEKEMRNYRRIHKAGIPCPQPVLLKQHVLVMEFLGTGGWPSPRLKDATLSDRRRREAYIQCVLILRHLYQRCKLVHGDLSEYNLLWHNQQVYVIDVSQSVETDHPSALDFLRKDIANVNDYFRKVGRLTVMTTRQLFDFITVPLEDESEEAELASLDAVMLHVDETAARRQDVSEQERREEEQQVDVDEAVFMSSFLPRSLNQVADQDIRKLEDGDVEASYALAVASLTGNKEVVDIVVKKTGRKHCTPNSISTINVEEVHTVEPDKCSGTVRVGDVDNPVRSVTLNDCGDESSGSETGDGDSSVSSSESNEPYVKVARTPEQLQAEREALKAKRKENKKIVKEAQSEKRKDKVKKKDKKRAIKKSKAGNRKTK